MLTANELRIGNLIEYNGMNVTIFSIDKKEFVTFDTAQVVIGGRKYEQSPSLHIKNFIPIPLSEEWLLKFGFEDTGSALIMQVGHGGSIDWDGMAFYVNMCEADIKQVHQLQNLYFSLTGEELTFKN